MKIRAIADKILSIMCGLMLISLSCYAFIQKQKAQTVPASSVQKTIFLTFDDGPSAKTPDILKVLEQHGVSATFFVTGQNADCLPLLTEIDGQGHLVAPHTYSHRFSEIYSGEQAFWKDQQKILSEILTYTATTPSLLRFAGGSSNTVYRNYAPANLMDVLTDGCEQRNITYVDWNIDSRDWENNRSAAGIYSSVMTQINRCTDTEIVVLFHDAPCAPNTAAALGDIIEALKQQGYAFDTADHLTADCHHNF